MEIPASTREKFNPAAVHFEINQPRSNRDALINDFLARLNPDRLKKGMAEITPARVAKMLKDAGYAEHTWHALYKSCDRARSFGGLFWHLMKPKV